MPTNNTRANTRDAQTSNDVLQAAKVLSGLIYISIKKLRNKLENRDDKLQKVQINTNINNTNNNTEQHTSFKDFKILNWNVNEFNHRKTPELKAMTLQY